MSGFILIVDDDDGIRTTVAELLIEEGYRCEAAENGAEALQKLDTMAARPCVMLLDLMMPVMSGWEVLEELQKRGVGIPVVVATAKGQATVPGAARVLHKPFRLDTLLSAVREFCSGA